MVPRVFQELLGWLHVLVGIGGVVACALFASRSRWSFLLMGGFALDTLVAGGYRVATLLMAGAAFDASRFGAVFFALGLLGLLGRLAVVAGVAALLSSMAAAPPAAGQG